MRELLYAMIKNSGYGTIIESASSTAQFVRCDRNFIRVKHKIIYFMKNDNDKIWVQFKYGTVKYI